MKKFAALVLAGILVMSFCGTAAAEGSPDAELSLISCPEEDFTTMADTSYRWEISEYDLGINIYTGGEGIIPYVNVWRRDDLFADPYEYLTGHWTSYLQETYELVDYTEYEAYDMGGRQLPATLHTYREDGILHDVLRLIDSTGGRSVFFTAWYVHGEGEDTLEALDTAIRYFKTETDGSDSSPTDEPGGAAPGPMNVPGVDETGGTFGEYWDFQQEDGTYAYAFPRIKVSMNENWYQKTMAVVGEGGSTVSFYHKGSYDAYAAEGLEGGLLFMIGASVNSDFQNLPDFTYIGFDEEEMLNYYAARPTDCQAYMGDEATRAEYDELFSGVDAVIASAQIAS